MNSEKRVRININGSSRDAVSEAKVVEILRKHLSMDVDYKFADAMRVQEKGTAD